MSVAQLGFAVDSAPLVAGTKALNDLTAAAKPAAVAAADLSKASTASSNAMRAGTAAVNDHAKAHAGLSTQAMAAQHSIRSMVEQLAMGVPPTQVLTTQLNHLSYAASGPGGLSAAFSQALASFKTFLTPTTLIVGGLGAIAFAAAAAVASVAKLAEQFQDSARAAGTTVGQLQGFAAAASFKGIGNADFLTSIDKFSASVYAAKNNMGGLADVLTANGKRAGDLVQDFGTISDLVKSAAGNTQLQFSILQQSGLPATMQWVRFLSQGKDAIAAQVAEFSKNGPQMDALAAKAHAFQEAWDKAIANLKFGFQSAILSVAGFFDTLSDKATAFLMRIPGIGSSVPTNMLRNALTNNAAGYQAGSKLTNNSSVDQFYSSLGTGAPGNAATKPPVDPEVAKNAIARQQQQIGLLGDLATVEDRVTSAQLSLNAAALNHVTVSDKQAAAIINAARAQAEMNLVQQQASVGVFNLDAANKAAADTLQMWVDKHLLDPSNAEQMSAALTVLSKSTRDLSDAAKVAGSSLPQLQQALNDASNVNKQIDQFASSSFNSITTGLADIFDGTKSASQGFSDLSKTVLRSLEEMLIKMYVVLPIFNSLKGVLGGGLSSFLPSVVPSANGNVFPANDNGISQYSNTVVSSPTLFKFASGIGLMGEAGAEAIMPLTRGSDGKLGVAATGAGSSGSKSTINIYGATNPQNVQVQETIDGRGNRRLDITLDEQVASALSRPGSKTRQAMNNNYGAKAAGVRR